MKKKRKKKAFGGLKLGRKNRRTRRKPAKRFVLPKH
jgi:hypothetical protein